MSNMMIGLAATTIFALAAADANALSIRITNSVNGVFGDGDDTVTVINNGDALDENASPEIVAFNGDIGNYTNIGVTSIAGSSARDAFITQVLAIDTRQQGVSGVLLVETSAEDFVLPTSGVPVFALDYTANGTTFNEGLDTSAFFNPSNASFGSDDQIGSELSLSNADKSDATSDTATPASPFSLAIRSFVSHGEGAPPTQYDTIATVSAVPLPASVMLLLSAMVGLGFVTRRKASA